MGTSGFSNSAPASFYLSFAMGEGKETLKNLICFPASVTG
jgi:hypothetical protein